MKQELTSKKRGIDRLPTGNRRQLGFLSKENGMTKSGPSKLLNQQNCRGGNYLREAAHENGEDKDFNACLEQRYWLNTQTS